MSWPRLLRPILAIIVLAAAAVAAVIAALPFIVSTDAIRIRLAQELSAWTGYSVELRQPPRLTVFPVFQASLSDVTLSKLGQSGQQPVMSADRIDVELSAFDALMGHISFSETRLIRPRFRLNEPVTDLPQLFTAAANSQGRLGMVIRAAKTLVESNPDDPQMDQLASQPFGRIVIENGSLAYRRFGSPLEEQVSDINGTLDWPQTSSPASFRGRANWRGEAAEINFSASQALILLANGMSAITASVTSKPLTFTFDGKANISQNMFFEGALTANSPSLGDTMRWAGRTSSGGSSMIGAVELAANVTVTPQRAKFNDVMLTTDKQSAKGVIEIGLEQPVPAVTGTLAFQSLDLRSLISAFIPLPRADAGDEIDTRFVNQLDLDLRLSAQNATAGPVSLANLAAAVQVRGGRAIFDIGDAKAFNGSVQANIQIIGGADGANSELRFNGSDLDSAALASTLGVKQPFLTGKGAVSLLMKSPLTKWSSLLESASGNISLDLGNGQVQGFDFNDFINKARNDRFFALERKQDASLDFNRLSVKAAIAEGIATLENARVETGNGVLTLAGIVPFLDRSLALSGEIEFPAAPNQNQDQNAAAPKAPQPINFFVGGSWDRPFISPTSRPTEGN
ncbi:AsmA family protein [Phyllobacterium phragmitis]|uniref:AsmA family protein n=1 Tax=Phyllobacterium phragmitis TaxID=2670329 RepID=A0A2S9IL09_9HYPH|nr:AsmA family protein [Phyllobacterium phragmitis]PRD41185.1 AsmA family protein [Phyllobacterium phragmitis]